MNELYQPVAELLERVRTRWRRVVVLQRTARAALAVTAVLGLVLIVSRGIAVNPAAEAAFGVVAALAVVVAASWGLRGVRERPSDARIARFVEECHPGLDERLVSAVGVSTADQSSRPTVFASSMMADAARAASSIDAESVVLPETLRRAGIQTAAAVLLLSGLAFLVRGTARASLDALTLALFPSRITLEVTPGDARIEAGSALTVRARLVGNRAPVVAQLLRAGAEGSDDWRATPMDTDDEGRFSLSLNALATSFRYRVSAGAASSKTFAVAVVRAPRVTRIDVEYAYPKAFGLQNRVETDGGDIYSAPAGTEVRVHVHTDRPAASGRLLIADGQPIDLTPESSEKLLAGGLTIASDGSYRVALADREGLTSRGDTEYFIRTLEDRPPEVHVVRPASDRRVTRLEEVDIEAEAQDDFGIASLDLVYSLRGGPDTVVPLKTTPQQTSAVGRHTLFLEDLNVRPGDFISYYVRARDVPRGKRSSEARSDIFFLEVKPFEEEFTLAQSQAMMGGGQGSQQLDDLVGAQKEIIVATWKLDRRSRAASGAKSEQDIRAVGKAEKELKTRVEQASSAFRQGNMRDPRARPSGRGAPPPAPRAAQTMPEEDAMTVASNAMGHAIDALDALSTATAVTPEMEALNALLKAQADIKKRQVQQQAGSGAGSNRNIQDLSSLFDKELARHQQTNYETRNSTESRDEQNASAIDQIKELARRQDELARKQEQLAKTGSQMSEEERRRSLADLSREQQELVQRAEALAERMAERQNQAGQQNQSGQQNQAGQQNQPGSQGQPSQSTGQPGQSGPQNRPGQSGNPRPGQQANGRPGSQGRQMSDIAEEMRRASGDLRRDDAARASERSARALDQLRDLEQQLQNASPDGRRRALGDLQLEARQLADAERQIASESGRGQSSATSADSLRRLSAEQQRLADRVRQMQQRLDEQAGQMAGGGKDAGNERALQQAAGDASKELQRQRVAERMEQSADAMRSAAERGGGRGQAAAGATPPPASASGSAAAPEELARTLERVADRMASASRSGDDEARRLSDQLTRAQDLRDRMDSLTNQLEQMDRSQSAQNAARGGSSSARGTQSTSERAAGDAGRSGRGQEGTGGSGADLEQARADLNRQLQQVRDLLDETQRDEGTQRRGGVGRTFEGQGMTLSAPGTEAFKQDFAKWQELKRQATAALDRVEASVAERLQAKDSKDRLAAGADEAAPAGYQQQVDSYFKALATRKP